MHPLHTKSLAKIEEALKLFGVYTYIDKGPYEVMDVQELANDFRQLPAEETAQIYKEMWEDKSLDNCVPYLVESLIGSMEDWDELFDQLELPEYADIIW